MLCENDKNFTKSKMEVNPKMDKRTVVKCPTCDKRVMDIDAVYAVLYIKCPHCRKEHQIVWQRKAA